MSSQTACRTIEHALSLASAGNTIMIAPGVYGENLNIGFGLKIVGSSAGPTIIDGGGGRVVTISVARAHVTLSQVTIRNGHASLGGGGGIYNIGTLTISNSTVSGNLVTSYHGFTSGAGGGIFNTGTLTISNSTVSGNSVTFSCLKYCSASGAGIANTGTLTINNSTLSGNRAYKDKRCKLKCFALGGAVSNGGRLAINNSTLSENSAGKGGGISNSGTATLQNSIVANNSGGNCDGAMTSNGYNLSSGHTCNFNNAGDLNNTSPKLGQLGNYGGPTQTIPLLPGSPAIDAGNPSGCTDGKGNLLQTDQRGEPRPDKEDTRGCDMGAYESQSD